MSSFLSQQLQGVVEGPLGVGNVSGETVVERVGAVALNEKRHVFGTHVYRDGEGDYYVDDDPTPRRRRVVVEMVKDNLAHNGRLLDEKLDVAALTAMMDQQKDIDAAEKKIGAMFAKLAKRYTAALEKMTGAKWKVSAASESIFSLDSNESPRRSVDIYWEYDPGSQTATIFVEGPKGKQKAYSKQKMSDVPRKNYVDWLHHVLKEDMDVLLSLAFEEEDAEDDGLVEGQFGRKLAALDVVIQNQKRHGRSTTIGKGINQVSADEAKWMVSKRIAQWVETRKGGKAVSVDASSKRLWDFRNDLEDQAYESAEVNTGRGALIEEIASIIDLSKA